MRGCCWSWRLPWWTLVHGKCAERWRQFKKKWTKTWIEKAYNESSLVGSKTFAGITIDSVGYARDLHQVCQNVECCVHETMKMPPSYKLVRDRSPSKAPLAICTTGLALSCLLNKKPSVAVGERSRQIVYKFCRLLIPKNTPSMIVVIAFASSFLSIWINN